MCMSRMISFRRDLVLWLVKHRTRSCPVPPVIPSYSWSRLPLSYVRIVCCRFCYRGYHLFGRIVCGYCCSCLILRMCICIVRGRCCSGLRYLHSWCFCTHGTVCGCCPHSFTQVPLHSMYVYRGSGWTRMGVLDRVWVLLFMLECLVWALLSCVWFHTHPLRSWYTV